jgi:hypothetical protein
MHFQKVVLGAGLRAHVWRGSVDVESRRLSGHSRPHPLRGPLTERSFPDYRPGRSPGEAAGIILDLSDRQY